MFGRLKSLLTKKRQKFPRWHVDEDRKAYVVDGTELRWEHVTEVIAFKRDLLTIDQLCIGLVLDDREEVWVIEEDHPSFERVLADLGSRFPLVPDWDQQVIHPPFAENLTTIWSRTTSA